MVVSEAEKTEKITINLGLVDLGQIDLLEEVTSEAADVGALQTEAQRQLALNGKVEGLGIGCLDVTVDAPVDGEGGGSRRKGEGLRS